MRSDRTPAAGDALLNPYVLLALTLLIINDHVLKAAWPGWWTGKLSDFAGALFFPLLVQAGLELSLKGVDRYTGPSRAALWGGLIVTGVLFLITELSALGAALVGRVASLGDPLFPGSPELTPDVSDLAALAMLVVAYRIGMSRSREGNGAVSIAWSTPGPQSIAKRGYERETATNEKLV